MYMGCKFLVPGKHFGGVDDCADLDVHGMWDVRSGLWSCCAAACSSPTSLSLAIWHFFFFWYGRRWHNHIACWSRRLRICSREALGPGSEAWRDRGGGWLLVTVTPFSCLRFPSRFCFFMFLVVLFGGILDRTSKLSMFVFTAIVRTFTIESDPI